MKNVPWLGAEKKNDQIEKALKHNSMNATSIRLAMLRNLTRTIYGIKGSFEFNAS